MKKLGRTREIHHGEKDRVVTPVHEDVTLRVEWDPCYVGALYYIVKESESEDL
jgi:hypothetical protein